MCTSIKMQAADGNILFARTMDWRGNFTPSAITVPAGYSWKTVYNGKTVVNPYAILGVGHDLPNVHVDFSDGVNEYGFSAQKLTFSNKSEYLTNASNSENKLQLAAFEFTTWMLGNCKSVADLIDKLVGIELMNDEFSAFKFGRNDLHFSACDTTGRIVSIEPLDGKLVVLENPVAVVTNAPIFERELEKLAEYLDLTGQPIHENRISTGNFSGKPVWPGGFTPTSRFIRAAVLRERGIFPKNETQNVIETWHILNSVTVPRSDSRSDTSTLYRSAVSLDSRRLYLQRYDDFSIVTYQL
ncbi:linear amide C-N hydrolase [Lactovum miscens]|uniref:Choloylglycine hydrolase n=1 Tax=Lactovum miscens TaxID=190387 RepID=A0A841C6H9_9LACT|nr:linear amide C-N hydrolase [Lactovum miscens]MBB5887212.1 choloylglycine hydrolase [Lactovum miscens]